MKVILYMTTSVNGFIAKEDDDTSWVSKVEWDSFREIIKSVGNIVVGRRTYEIMKENKEFEGLSNIKVVVVTNESVGNKLNNVIFVSTPQKAIKILEEQNFNEALVCGGGKLNGSFMREKLVDEIYLDVEPMIFNKGIKLFGDADFEAKLELIDTKKLSKNEIQLHYKIIK